jgi:lysophospholipase L1-like esterase
MVRRAVLLILAAALSGCRGESPASSSPPPPGMEAPGDTELFGVEVRVFEDRDGDGRRSGAERPLEGVTVRVSDRQAMTGGDGTAMVRSVPRGTHRVSLGLNTVPPFLAPPLEALAVVPGGEVAVPLSLPIGNNVPDSYLAYGDSITSGDGASDRLGFRGRLQRKLEAFHGRRLTFTYRGNGGGRTDFAADSIDAALRVRPAFVLIQWGVNDWNSGCAPPACNTIRNLRYILQACRAAGSLPCLGTISPANTGYDQRTPPDRNAWVAEMNRLIRPLAYEEGALLVDVAAAFPPEGALRGLFVDHVHPNDTGHEIIAETYFRALTEPRGFRPPPLVRELSF